MPSRTDALLQAYNFIHSSKLKFGAVISCYLTVYTYVSHSLSRFSWVSDLGFMARSQVKGRLMLLLQTSGFHHRTVQIHSKIRGTTRSVRLLNFAGRTRKSSDLFDYGSEIQDFPL